MIGKIKGIVDTVEEDSAIIDVNGVGYVLYCTTNTLANLEIRSAQSFYTHMVVKEDQLTLFGFTSKQEKHWFNLLQTVQGVGPRMALAIVGSVNIQDISDAILSEDHSIFKSVSGVGPKLAARIVNELKGKKGILEVSSFNNAPSQKAPANNNTNDALSALENLGFARKDAYALVSEIQAKNENISLEEIIRLALTELTSS